MSEEFELRKRISELEEQLRKTAEQLRRWANESLTGGWSTHQVDPMRRYADKIDEIVYRKI
jgi:hypothetical protein